LTQVLGWDYSSRWYGNISLTGDEGLRTLRLRDLAPVDLNAILCEYFVVVNLYNFHNKIPDKAHDILADLYTSYPSFSSNATNFARSHRQRASELRTAVLDLHWDSDKLAFYDYIISERARSSIFSVATFYPFWAGIHPPEVLSNATAAFGAFSSINLVLNRYNGTYPTTLLVTGQQWDAPNAWPPHQHIALAALANLPANISNASLPLPGANQNTFSLVPTGQLGLEESELPAQPLHANMNASTSGPSADINSLNGTVLNGGNSTEGEGWTAKLQRELANRYIASALCSWYVSCPLHMCFTVHAMPRLTRTAMV
jgi:alpha,alpha-trehalase